jgi:AcrR family transcriptional regulator
MIYNPISMAEPRTRVRIRNDPRRARTRQRIVDATIQLVYEGGIGSLSTVAIADRADIHQPAFYAHFKNIDDCLAAAAVLICDRARLLFKVIQRDAIIERAPLEVIAPPIQRMLEIAIAQGAFATIFVRYRLDASPLGQGLGRVVDEAHRDLVDNLWELATRMRIADRYRPHISMLGQLCVLSVISGIEVLVEDRGLDPADVARIVSRQIIAVTREEFDDMQAASSTGRSDDTDVDRRVRPRRR